MNRPHNPSQSGFTLVETAVAMAILSLVMYAFVGSFINQAHSQLRSQLLLQAADYAREGLEVVYNMSSNSKADIIPPPSPLPTDTWNQLIGNKAGDGYVYHPHFQDTPPKKALLYTNPETINGFFTREIRFYEVKRNSLGEEDPSGATDFNVVKVVSTVTITHSQTNTSISVTSYLMNPHSI
jgi:prepilin-type N-terminal cleavage/methylation domain-containing protein